MTPQNIDHLIDAIAIILIALPAISVVAYMIFTDLKN